MISFPNAKINIGLNIVERRQDGFHNIESVFFPIHLTEILEVNKSTDTDSVFTSTGFTIPGEPADNLCMKAWELVAAAKGIGPVNMHLHKMIPIGAGLGGGSADAAFCIDMLNDEFKLRLKKEVRLEFAQQLGSDCGFFIENKPCLATGRGELLEPIDLDLSGYHMLVVYPGIHISTAEAYANVQPAYPEVPLMELVSLPIAEWQGRVVNAFEPSIFAQHPVLRELKSHMMGSGAIYASMTGSGSAIYGIFKEIPSISGLDDYFTWSGSL